MDLKNGLSGCGRNVPISGHWQELYTGGVSNSKVKRKSGKWKCLPKTLARFDVHLRLAKPKYLFVSKVKSFKADV
jgi:hypothetical protein